MTRWAGHSRSREARTPGSPGRPAGTTSGVTRPTRSMIRRFPKIAQGPDVVDGQQRVGRRLPGHPATEPDLHGADVLNPPGISEARGPSLTARARAARPTAAG